MTNDLKSLKFKLLRLEKGLWKAAGSNEKYLERTIATDSIAALPSLPLMVSKTALVEAITGSEAWDTFSLSNARVYSINNSDVALMYDAIGKRTGQPNYHARINSVYRNIKGTWRLALHQQLPLA